MPHPPPPRGEDYRRALDRLLAFVQTPGRYVGGEINALHKNDGDVAFRVALCFPDLYPVGMSPLGLRILYDAGNRLPGVAVERAFVPAPDFEAVLRDAGLPLATLESATPLAQCDAVAISMAYELGVTGLLTLLDAGGLPPTRRERRERARQGEGPWPWVLAGGHVAHNPEPYADFVDAFLVGDGEESFPEVLAHLRDHAPRASRTPDNENTSLLQLARAVEGVYAPALYPPHASPDGGWTLVPPPAPGPNAPPWPIHRRAVPALDPHTPPAAPIVPTSEATHERVIVEIMRGCPNGCRFCQAGFITRPVRARMPERIVDSVRCQLAATGYDEVGLLALSASDYPGLPQLAATLDGEFAADGINLSLPSLRVDAALSGLIPALRTVRPTGLTVAPEAGTERLRAVINKDVADETLLAAARQAYASGFSTIKLYFMVGLPTETDEDVEAIARLANAVADERARAGGRRGGKNGKAAVHLSVANFVPKAHTPFQWEPANAVVEWERKHRLIRAIVDRRRVDFASHDPRVSLLEAVFARGDRRLGAVALAAWRAGARLDAWSEHFRPDLWAQAFADTGLSPEAYAERAPTPGDPLPWSMVDSGLSEAFLRRERERAYTAARTAACAPGRCAGCGVPDCGFRCADPVPSTPSVS